jgi:large subunit ribosomal protein L18
MASKGMYTVHYRRKSKGRTNYKKRMAYLKSGLPRLVVRRFNRNILAQVVQFEEKGDKVLVSAHSSDLKKLGWVYNTGNIPASYLVGYLVGKKSPVKKMILDMGLHTPISGNRLFALLKGVIDAGVDTPYSKDILPPEDRLKGKHIAQYAKKLGDHKIIFSLYKKNNADPEKIGDAIEKTKSQIDSVVKNGRRE